MSEKPHKKIGNGTQFNVYDSKANPDKVLKEVGPIFDLLESLGLISMLTRAQHDLNLLETYADGLLIPSQIRRPQGTQRCVVVQQKVHEAQRLDNKTLPTRNHYQLKQLADVNRCLVEKTGYALDCFGGFNLPSILSNMLMDKKCFQLHNFLVNPDGNIGIPDILLLQTIWGKDHVQNADVILYHTSHAPTLQEIGRRTGTKWL
jgi:hypothetical protein